MTTQQDQPRPERKPGRVFYLLALVPPVLGLIVMVAILVVNMPKMDDGLQQIVVPGERSLMLKPGSNSVFLETRSVVDGRVYSVDGMPVSGLVVHVEGADGTPVAMAPTIGSSNYSLNGREGYAINTFQIDRAGPYKVSADYESGEGPATVIAVGQGFVGTLLVTIFSALGAIFLSMIVSVAIVIWVFASRRRTRRVV